MVKHRPRGRLAALLVLLIGVVVAIAAGSIAVRFFNRPAVRAWLAARLAREAAHALGQPVAIGDLRTTLVPPRIVVSNVAVGEPAAPFLTVGTAEVTIGRVHLAERQVVINQLRLVGVRLHGKLPALEHGGAGHRGWVGVTIRQLEMTDVKVDRFQIAPGVIVRAAELEARWSGSARRPIAAAIVRVADFALLAPGVEPVTGSIEGWGHATDKGWEIGRLRGEGPGWSLQAQGVIADGEATAHGRATVGLAQLDRVLSIGAGLGGTAEAEWKAEIGRGTFRVDASLRSPRVSVVGFDFAALSGDARVSSDGIEATLASATYAGGTVSGSYSLESLGPPWRHHVAVRGAGVDLAAFLGQIHVDAAGLASHCQVSAEVDWEGTRIGAGSGTAIVDLTPAAGDVPAAGRVTLGLDGAGAMTMRSEGATLAGYPVVWEGRLTLGSWVPNWTVQSERIAVGVVHRLLAGWVGSSVWPEALEGVAALDVTLRGPFRELTVTGNATAAPLRLGSVAFDSARGGFTFEHGRLTFDDARLDLDGGETRVAGTIDVAAGGALRLGVNGERLPLDEVVAWTGVKVPVRGRLGVTATLGGTIDEPAFDARLRFAQVVVAGVPFGEGAGRASLADGTIRFRQVDVGPFATDASVDLRRRRVDVDATLRRFGLDGVSPLLARIAGSALDLELHGAFPFDRPSGRLVVSSAAGARGTVELDASGLRVALDRPGVWRLEGGVTPAGEREQGRFSFAVGSLETLTRDLAGEFVPVSGKLAGTADLTVEANGRTELDGVVASLVATVGGDEVTAKEPIHFKVASNEVEIPTFTLAGPIGRIAGHLHHGADGSLDAKLQGRVPASLVGLLWPSVRLGGTGDVTIEVSGTDARPLVVGRALVHEGSILLPGLPAPLTHVEGELSFVPEAIRMNDVAFSLGSGSGTIAGQIALSPHLELDLDARVSDLRWPVTAGFVPILRGRVRIVGGLDELSVSGDATLEHTVFREEINLQRLVLQQLLTAERAAPSAKGAVALNLAVAVPGTLEVDTPLARLTLRGQVRVTGTSVQPGLVGRLEAMPGGEVDLSGQQFELDHASATFSDPDRIAPYLDVLGRTVVETVEITVGLNGTLDRLAPTLISNPPLPETDILALLSTGRRASQTSGAQAGALAGSFLTEELAGAVTRRARTLLDVDQLRVDPFAATETGTPTARLTVVKQIAHDWTVTVSTNLATNREEVVQSRWRLGPALYLEASRDIDGSYSLGVRWRRRY
jgi:autotransporter translocation and assembly factor TamB